MLSWFIQYSSQNEKTPSLNQGDALFEWKKGFPCIKETPSSNEDDVSLSASHRMKRGGNSVFINLNMGLMVRKLILL